MGTPKTQYIKVTNSSRRYVRLAVGCGTCKNSAESLQNPKSPCVYCLGGKSKYKLAPEYKKYEQGITEAEEETDGSKTE